MSDFNLTQHNDALVSKLRHMREALELLRAAENEYQSAGLWAEALSLGVFISYRQRGIDFYIVENFPIMERKS